MPIKYTLDGIPYACHNAHVNTEYLIFTPILRVRLRATSQPSGFVFTAWDGGIQK